MVPLESIPKFSTRSMRKGLCVILQQSIEYKDENGQRIIDIRGI